MPQGPQKQLGRVQSLRARLPKPIQTLADTFMPVDQLPSPAVSIGPKAVPFWDPKGYMNKAMRSTFDDMVAGRGTKALDPKIQHLQDALKDVERLSDPSAIESIIDVLARGFTSGPFNK